MNMYMHIHVHVHVYTPLLVGLATSPFIFFHSATSLAGSRDFRLSLKLYRGHPTICIYCTNTCTCINTFVLIRVYIYTCIHKQYLESHARTSRGGRFLKKINQFALLGNSGLQFSLLDHVSLCCSSLPLNCLLPGSRFLAELTRLLTRLL